MSLPPELRVLCFQLTALATPELPRHIPTLLRYVQVCQGSISNAAADSSASVLVHKLKTHLSVLLNGKAVEGRLSAILLIKTMVEVGGWEILQSSEPWVRGLLNILVKPDPAVIKEMCMLALTKLYLMTHQYQTLVREITTPTLPTYVNSCLNIVSPKLPIKAMNVPSSLLVGVFRSFAILIPRHTSIFRPFASQIRHAVRPYLCPTLEKGPYISSELKRSARQLHLILYQTAPKNTGGEDWSRGLRELIKDIHLTADNVFRSVIEDWESTSGYIGQPADVNKEASGGGRFAEDLSHWVGVDAGANRLLGMLELLSEYFQVDSPETVVVPLESVLDVFTRMLSIAMPTVSRSTTGNADLRLHPAIGRDERDELRAHLASIYEAALQLGIVVADRLGESFVPIAQACLDQATWVFPYGKHVATFRSAGFDLVAKILQHIGNSFSRKEVVKIAAIIRSCCKDLYSSDHLPSEVTGVVGLGHTSMISKSSSSNTDTYIRNLAGGLFETKIEDSASRVSASKLLPLFISHIPQQHLDISLRSLIERTAVLTKNKDTMLASVLNPFFGRNGRPLASILPQLTSAYGSDTGVESLLRPRMPLLPALSTRMTVNTDDDDDLRDENMDFELENRPEETILEALDAVPLSSGPALSRSSSPRSKEPKVIREHTFGTHDKGVPAATSNIIFTDMVIKQIQSQTPMQRAVDMDAEDSSDDESVHLTMQLDTESENEGD